MHARHSTIGFFDGHFTDRYPTVRFRVYAIPAINRVPTMYTDGLFFFFIVPKHVLNLRTILLLLLRRRTNYKGNTKRVRRLRCAVVVKTNSKERKKALYGFYLCTYTCVRAHARVYGRNKLFRGKFSENRYAKDQFAVRQVAI